MRIATEESRQQAAALVLQVIDGSVIADDAISAIGQTGIRDDSVDRALHALCHYRDDLDIRQRDRDYAELQTNALRAMADRLSHGLPLLETQGYW